MYNVRPGVTWCECTGLPCPMQHARQRVSVLRSETTPALMPSSSVRSPPPPGLPPEHPSSSSIPAGLEGWDGASHALYDSGLSSSAHFARSTVWPLTHLGLVQCYGVDILGWHVDASHPSLQRVRRNILLLRSRQLGLLHGLLLQVCCRLPRPPDLEVQAGAHDFQLNAGHLGPCGGALGCTEPVRREEAGPGLLARAAAQATACTAGCHGGRSSLGQNTESSMRLP